MRTSWYFWHRASRAVIQLEQPARERERALALSTHARESGRVMNSKLKKQRTKRGGKRECGFGDGGQGRVSYPGRGERKEGEKQPKKIFWTVSSEKVHSDIMADYWDRRAIHLLMYLLAHRSSLPPPFLPTTFQFKHALVIWVHTVMHTIAQWCHFVKLYLTLTCVLGMWYKYPLSTFQVHFPFSNASSVAFWCVCFYFMTVGF